MKKLFNLFKRRKPFNLDKALAGEPVVTRDGREVRNLHSILFSQYEVEGSVGSCCFLWYADGRYSENLNTPLDLFMK